MTQQSENRMHYLKLRDIECAISEWGSPEAPLMVYLHGWADTGSTFQFVANELASNWHIVAPDLRGFGRTTSRADSYWFPDYLADLHILLQHYSPDSPVRLVGHSMGANIAGLYAGTFPERVSGFVNVEGFGLPDSDPDDAPDRYRRWIEAGLTEQSWSTYPSYEVFAAKLQKTNPELDSEAALFVARQWATESDVVTPRADPNHKRPNAVLYRRAEAEACWRRITAQILLIAGSRSRFAKQFGSSATLPFPNCRAEQIDDAGHMIHFEQPQALAKIIQAFFTETL